MVWWGGGKYLSETSEKSFTPQGGSKYFDPSLPHEFMHTHICPHTDSCAYLIILTCRHTIIEYVKPEDRLRRKQNWICNGKKYK